MDIQSIRRQRLAQLISEKYESSQAKFINETGENQGEISALLKDKSFGEKKARKIEIECGLPKGWLDRTAFEPQNYETVSSSKMPVFSAEDSHQPVGMIEYWNARGSCGGGVSNESSLPKGHLIKEESFFAKYNLRPNNAFAIYADGDSMADFIVDGDIVIFDKSKKTPISGKIFAIEHPDGLRIKVLRRSIEGAWILESKNVDKRTFPDEVIPADHTELLKIHGQFVYRQGG